jgi:hypothetical protein
VGEVGEEGEVGDGGEGGEGGGGSGWIVLAVNVYTYSSITFVITTTTILRLLTTGCMPSCQLSPQTRTHTTTPPNYHTTTTTVQI